MAGEVVHSDSWERSFDVLSREQGPDMPTEVPWIVWDAECQFVARCASEENAKAVALALNGKCGRFW